VRLASGLFGAALALGLFVTGLARAQKEEAGTQPAAPNCGDKAALYAAGKTFRMWVTRKGSLAEENPLRPLTKDQLTVLQIVVNNKVASAYGPDFDNMRRGGPPQQLEAANHTTIAWQPVPDELPRAIRVVADDGTLVLGPITFVECGDAPTVMAAPAPRKPRKPAASTGEARPSVALPQGAIP
jgi:hypothetical protein